MLLECLKNYIKFVKYLLIIMGVLYFFFLIAVALFVNGAGRIVASQSSEIYDRIMDYLTGKFSGTSVGISVYASGNVWYEVGSEIVKIIREGGETSLAEIIALVGSSTVLIALGLKLSESVGYFYFKREVGGETARYGLVNWIVKFLIGAVFSVAFVAFLFLWKYGGIVVPVVYLLINAAQTLQTTWFVYFSKTDRKKIAVVKNVLKVVSVELASYALFAAVFVVLFWFVSPIIAFVIAVPLFVYSDCIVAFTTVTYFKKKAAAEKEIR